MLKKIILSSIIIIIICILLGLGLMSRNNSKRINNAKEIQPKEFIETKLHVKFAKNIKVLEYDYDANMDNY